jgi:two-component system LytT family sensor kinase
VAIQSIGWRFYLTQSAPKPVPLEFIVRAEVLMFGIAAALTPGIAYAARRFPLGRDRSSSAFLMHIFTGVVVALTVKLAWDFAMLPFYATPWIHQFSWLAFRRSLLAGLQANVLLYWVAVIGITAIDHARRYRQTAIEAAELRAQLAEAQLHRLRIQLDPHFLFNTLHSISELVHNDPDTADLMIANLSELLRQSLARSDRHEILLSEELEFVKLYLDIQCRRFPDRLTVRYDIGSAASRALIPGMILQPLIENSIRHAIAPRRSGGSVLIRAGLEERQILLEVEDFGGQPAAMPIIEGIGLRNTRERLEKMYAGRHRFELLPGREGLRVRVSLPYHREAADAG